MWDKKLNIFIIVLDTLRKDYSRNLHNILEKHGFISYNNCVSTSPWTIPSHESLLTGLYPSYHGVHVSKHRKLPSIYYKNYNFSLHIVLRNMGYMTILLSANTMVSPAFSLEGFEVFRDIGIIPRINLLSREEENKLLRVKNEIIERGGRYSRRELILKLLRHSEFRILLKKAIEKYWQKVYLELVRITKNYPMEKGVSNLIKYTNFINNIKNPIFALINLMEVHEPYQLKENGGLYYTLKGLVDDNTIRVWKEKYPVFAEYMFKKLEIFIKNINDKILNNSIIIVTSDHGQLLGEGGRLGHGVFLDDELLTVPLLIRYPDSYNVCLSGSEGYVSLAGIKDYILYLLRDGGKKVYDEKLFSEYVVAESYGIPFDRKYFSDSEYERIAILDKHRVAFYWKDLKVIYNVSERNVEKVEPPDSDVPEKMMSIIRGYVSNIHRLERIRKIKMLKK